MVFFYSAAEGLRTLVLFACLSCVVLMSSISSASEKVGSKSNRDFFEVSWPQSYVKFGGAGSSEKIIHDLPGVIFLIPGEYLDKSGLEKDEAGSIRELSIAFELPGPTPFLQGKTDAEKNKITLGERKKIRRFYMIVNRDGAFDYTLMRAKVHRAENNYGKYLQNGEVDGLSRFSPYACIDKQGGASEAFVRYIEGKEQSDPSPSGCRVHPTSSEWLTENSESEFVFASCIVVTCRLKFNFEGRAVTITVNYEDMRDWKEIVGSARSLLEGFKI